MDKNIKKQGDSLMDDSLAFFGAITASVSHELNNVIAIMDQTTGLLEDRLAGATDEVRITPEKLEKIVTSLQKQAGRGLDIIKRLNRFAHSTDQVEQKFDVRETLDNLIQLSHRLAGLKGAVIESGLPDSPVEIESNPFYIQQAVFAAFKTVLGAAQKGDTIIIGLNLNERMVEVIVDGPMSVSDSEGLDLSGLRRILDRLSGEIKTEAKDQRLCIHLTFPG